MTTRFDLEQHIMKCWSVVEDVNLIYEKSSSLSEDERQNALLGIISIYNLKFQELWDCFENCITDLS